MSSTWTQTIEKLQQPYFACRRIPAKKNNPFNCNWSHFYKAASSDLKFPVAVIWRGFSTLSCRTTQRPDPRTTPGRYQQTAPLQGLLLPHRTPAGTGGKGAWPEVQPHGEQGPWRPLGTALHARARADPFPIQNCFGQNREAQSSKQVEENGKTSKPSAVLQLLSLHSVHILITRLHHN